MLVKGNLFVNSLPGNSVGLSSQGIIAEVCCNAFNGLATPTLGAVDFVDNVINGSLPACAVPEPSSWMLFLAGSAALGGFSRRRPGGPPAGSDSHNQRLRRR